MSQFSRNNYSYKNRKAQKQSKKAVVIEPKVMQNFILNLENLLNKHGHGQEHARSTVLPYFLKCLV